MHARASSFESAARRGSTAVALQAPMWLMPAADFLALDALRPHQDLVAEGKVVMYEPSMRTVFFVSHQWTAFDHPDHSAHQLRMSGVKPRLSTELRRRFALCCCREAWRDVGGAVPVSTLSSSLV